TLLLDVSSSVLDAGLLDEQLVKQVFFASLSEQAKVALCAFGGELKCLTPPTREIEVLLDGFEEALNFGRQTRNEGTRLYAPVNRAMYDYKKFDLDKLAAESGGRAYEPGSLDKKSLATILKSIATEITMENVVGYQPDGPATGKKRHVRVELVDRTLGSIKD